MKPIRDFADVTNEPGKLRRAIEFGGMPVSQAKPDRSTFKLDSQLLAGLILGAVLAVAVLALCGALHPSTYEWAMGVGK